MSLSAQWANAIGQVKANRRLAVMLGVIALIGVVLVVDLGIGVLAAQRSELQALSERRERLEALSGSTGWLATARDAEAAAAALEATVPSARSPGLAQAVFQGWLRDRTAGMDGEVFTEVGTPQDVEGVEGATNLVRVTATVTGRSHRDTVIDLMRRAEASTDLITVDAFSLPADADAGFSATFSAYFRIDAAAEDEA